MWTLLYIYRILNRLKYQILNLFYISKNIEQNPYDNTRYLEALAVDDSGAGLIVFFLGDPQSFKGGQGTKDGATDPDRVLTLRGSNNLDLDGGWSQCSNLLLHAVSNTSVHGGTTRHDNVGQQVLPDVNVALHDGGVDDLMDTNRFHTKEGRLEERLRSTETLTADGDDLTIRKFIRFVYGRGSCSSVHLTLIVQGNVAELLLDVTDDLTLSGGGEGVALLSHDLHQVVCDVTTSQVKTEDGMRKSETFIDGYHVGHTITRVTNITSGTTRGIKGEDSLDANVHGGHIEGFEHDLSHLLTVGLGVKGSLSKHDGALLRGHTELIVEGVVPDLLHVIPVGDDTMLDGVLEGEDTSLALGLFTDVGVLLTHTDHHTLVTGTANDGGEDSSGSVISGEASFDQTGAIVADEGRGIFVVTHGGGGRVIISEDYLS